MKNNKKEDNKITNITGVNAKKPVSIKESNSDSKYYNRTVKEINKMPEIDITSTICPECKLIITGKLYKDENNVMIMKECPEHGLFIEKYWEDYELYMKMKKYNYNGRGIDNPNYANKGENCPFDCGICDRHKSHTGLANVVVTNRCHLSCWYCFFYAKSGDLIYEPTLEEFDNLFINLRSQKPIAANALQLTGGEPTLHPKIVEIVKLAKLRGFDQIQLNTTGINLGFNIDLAIKLKKAGVSTLYMSFDGVSKKANPKNHWEVPLILKAARKANIGIVLVPTVIRTINENELGSMINFGLNNIDIVRAVNFQPVSLVGRMPKKQRQTQRITIPGTIKQIEDQTNGNISKDDWFSVPCLGSITKFLEAATNSYKYDLSIHFACGTGTYLFLDGKKVIPITRFLDVAGLTEYLQEVFREMDGKSSIARKAYALKSIPKISSFIDKQKQPKSINVLNLLLSVFTKNTFNSLGKFQMNSLFLGIMHFQDEYTYDIKRVEKCNIHYAMPDGEILPFCTFNVLPEIYRDKIQNQYSISKEEWAKTHPDWKYSKDKYIRDVKKLEALKEYKKTYGNLIDYFK